MKNAPRFYARIGAFLLLSAMTTGAAWAQNTTTKSVKHGQTTYDTQVSNADVAYVEGNDLVLRNPDGKIEHFVVPDSDRFNVNGREVSVNELTPGTKLTQTITTRVTPRFVTTVQTIKGTVWHVNAPNTIHLRLPDHKIHVFQVPKNAKFTIEGRPKTVFDVRKGMNIEATVITDSQETLMSSDKSVVAELPTPATPREAGLLLIVTPQAAAIAPPNAEEAAEVAQTLPKTGSVLPLVGLFGTLATTLSLGLTTLRCRFNV